MSAMREDDDWMVDLDAIQRSMRRVEPEPTASTTDESGVRPRVSSDQALHSIFDDENERATKQVDVLRLLGDVTTCTAPPLPKTSAAAVVRPSHLPERRRAAGIMYGSLAIVGAIVIAAALVTTRLDDAAASRAIEPAPQPAQPVATSTPVATTQATATQATTVTSSPQPMEPRTNIAAPRANIVAHAPAQEKPAPEPEPTVELPKTPPNQDGANLGNAMKDAVGAKDDSAGIAKTESKPSGQVHIRPPAGMVNAAVNGVVARARVCLPEGSAVAHGTITFDTSGVAHATIRDVVLPEIAACVVNVLASARIDPFVEGPYTVNVTVRP
jgi:hypothetical protein